MPEIMKWSEVRSLSQSESESEVPESSAMPPIIESLINDHCGVTGFTSLVMPDSIGNSMYHLIITLTIGSLKIKGTP